MVIVAAFGFMATDAMFVLVAKKLACARLHDMLQQKLFGVATPRPKSCAQCCVQ